MKIAFLVVLLGSVASEPCVNGNDSCYTASNGDDEKDGNSVLQIAYDVNVIDADPEKRDDLEKSLRLLQEATSSHGKADARFTAIMSALQKIDGLTNPVVNKHLNKTTRDIFEKVKTVLTTIMYTSMATDKDALQSQVNEAHAALNNCNTVKDNAMVGDVKNRSTTTDTKRTDNKVCRDELNDLNQTKNTAWEELSTHLRQIQDPSEKIHKFPGADGTYEDFRTFFKFDGTQYSTWFISAKESFLLVADAYDVAKTNKDAKETKCTTEQSEFETAYCAWKQALETTCTNYDTCFADKNTTAGHSFDKVKDAEKGWKGAYTASQKIICSIEVLLTAEEKDCANEVMDFSRWTISYPTLSNKAQCDATPATNGPCTEEFVKTEYTIPLDASTPADTCTACA